MEYWKGKNNERNMYCRLFAPHEKRANKSWASTRGSGDAAKQPSVFGLCISEFIV